VDEGTKNAVRASCPDGNLIRDTGVSTMDDDEKLAEQIAAQVVRECSVACGRRPMTFFVRVPYKHAHWTLRYKGRVTAGITLRDTEVAEFWVKRALLGGFEIFHGRNRQGHSAHGGYSLKSNGMDIVK
jgi:hypothetical protein